MIAEHYFCSTAHNTTLNLTENQTCFPPPFLSTVSIAVFSVVGYVLWSCGFVFFFIKLEKFSFWWNILFFVHFFLYPSIYPNNDTPQVWMEFIFNDWRNLNSLPWYVNTKLTSTSQVNLERSYIIWYATYESRSFNSSFLIVFLFVSVCLFLFWKKFSPCNPNWPQIQVMHQALWF